jgi:predicted enzyme related to lactoylglutathione lyase
MQSWYVKTFGAKPVEARGSNTAAELPGVNLTFSKDEMNVAGTKGRSLDHIGFEVKNLQAYCKKLEAAGVKLDQPYHQIPNSKVWVAYVTDPAGTYIELTEGLDPK